MQRSKANKLKKNSKQENTQPKIKLNRRKKEKETKKQAKQYILKNCFSSISAPMLDR